MNIAAMENKVIPHPIAQNSDIYQNLKEKKKIIKFNDDLN